MMLTFLLIQMCISLLAYSFMGLMTLEAATTAAIALPPAFITSYLGIRLKNRVNERVFRYSVLCAIVAVALVGLARMLIGLCG